ncbi:BolA family transcriptional regulator [Nitrincola tibetensis]|uniref:BolA family transcriptional regulator n=1 Tax=Nitrincola tibetensis TaxID=2219697 RepID=A0A364NP08_9GAMM|nr:BolA family protein [Nitrincola tibetensis]RAU18617.1 BolA family transcriptional regulator [Nitrincola tibetensis]
MSVEKRIEALVKGGIRVEGFVLENESHMHSGPASESHFKLAVVSPDFVGLTKVRRHQTIYSLVAELMQNPIHALAMHLYTPDEWAEQEGQVPLSPNCMGGSKK